MASGFQLFTATGNIGTDPELRFTQGGTAILKFRLAVSERKKQNEEWVDDTQWFSCTVWAKRAEALEKILAKGDMIQVVGRIENSEWKDKEGNQRRGYDIVCREVILCGGRKQRQESAGGTQNSGGPGGTGSYGDDNLPF